MSIGRRTLMLPGIAGAVLMLSVTPASASSSPAISGLHGGRATQLFPNETDAGYIISGTGETTASATFVIPTFTCTDSQEFDMTVQMEGSGSSATFAVSFVTVTCSGAGATPAFSTLTCAGLNTNSQCATRTVTVASGDKIRMTTTVTSTASTAKLTNLTTKKGQSISSTGDATTSNANFLVQRNQATIPTFTKVVFTAATINSLPLTSFSTPTANTMTDASNLVQVRPGKISATGKTFSTTFKRNS